MNLHRITLLVATIALTSAVHAQDTRPVPPMLPEQKPVYKPVTRGCMVTLLPNATEYEEVTAGALSGAILYIRPNAREYISGQPAVLPLDFVSQVKDVTGRSVMLVYRKGEPLGFAYSIDQVRMDGDCHAAEPAPQKRSEETEKLVYDIARSKEHDRVEAEKHGCHAHMHSNIVAYNWMPDPNGIRLKDGGSGDTSLWALKPVHVNGTDDGQDWQVNSIELARDGKVWVYLARAYTYQITDLTLSGPGCAAIPITAQ